MTKETTTLKSETILIKTCLKEVQEKFVKFDEINKISESLLISLAIWIKLSSRKTEEKYKKA